MHTFTIYLQVLTLILLLEQFLTVTVVAAAGRNRRSPPSCNQICDYVEPEGDAYCGRRNLSEVPLGCSGSVLLDLRGNELHELHQGEFRPFTNLMYLDLSANALENLPPRVFSGATQLLDVYITENRLSNIGHDAFADTGNIRSIYLSRNEIQTLPPSIFRGLGNLNVLFLSKNSIGFVSRHLFKHNVNLTHVNLAHNRLEVLLAETFKHLTKLEFVDLSFNSLLTFQVSPFVALPHLRILKAANNSLTSDVIDPRLLKSPKFETLVLSGNRIESIPNSLEDLQLFKLRLGQNPLVCDCSLRPLQKLYSDLQGEEWVSQVTCSNGEALISAELECPSTASVTPTRKSEVTGGHEEETNGTGDMYSGGETLVIPIILSGVVFFVCFCICSYVIIKWVRSCKTDYSRVPSKSSGERSVENGFQTEKCQPVPQSSSADFWEKKVPPTHV